MQNHNNNNNNYASLLKCTTSNETETNKDFTFVSMGIKLSNTCPSLNN